MTTTPGYTVDTLLRDVAAARREREEMREERDAAIRDTELMASENVFHGNSTSWWWSKAENYKAAIGRVWDALNKHGVKADGKTPCDVALDKELTVLHAALARAAELTAQSAERASPAKDVNPANLSRESRRILNEKPLAASPAKDGGEQPELKWALDAGDVLADWCNRSGSALQAMMDAYERRIRTLCTPEQLIAKPWECAEWIEARDTLRAKPVAVVEIESQSLASQMRPQSAVQGVTAQSVERASPAKDGWGQRTPGPCNEAGCPYCSTAQPLASQMPEKLIVNDDGVYLPIERTADGNWAIAKKLDGTPYALVHPSQMRPQSAVQGWQPIETAPKDGTVVIVGLISPQSGMLMRASDAKYNKPLGWWDTNGANSCHWATHWIPQPPQGEGK